MGQRKKKRYYVCERHPEILIDTYDPDTAYLQPLRHTGGYCAKCRRVITKSELKEVDRPPR